MFYLYNKKLLPPVHAVGKCLIKDTLYITSRVFQPSYSTEGNTGWAILSMVNFHSFLEYVKIRRQFHVHCGVTKAYSLGPKVAV